jgi:hypothetical protein
MPPSQGADSGAALCPSARCEKDAFLLGVIQEAGAVAFLSQRMKVDQFFVELAHQGRTPEKRFRFAGTCMKAGCQQWTGSRCGVIDRLITDNPEFHGALPACPIRSDCRWHKQHGARACAICPQVVTDLIEPEAAPAIVVHPPELAGKRV